LVKDCFLAAYDRGELRGDDQLQEWYKMYKDYKGSKKDTPRYFSQSIMSKCNSDAKTFATDICLDKDTENVNQWRERFLAISEFSLPTTRLSSCLITDDAILGARLEGTEGGFQLDIKSRGEIIKAWKDSIGGKGRFKGFVPVVSSLELSKFFFDSGGTAYRKSVDELLDQSAESLRSILWGASVGSRGARKGLALEALQTKNAEHSYLNATLIIFDLERLCTADDEAEKGKVSQIVDFLKCITDTSLDSVNSSPFKFSYLGFDDGSERTGGANLSQFNVLLSTPTMSFDDIIQGLTDIVGANSARALRDRLTFVAQKEQVKPVNSDAQVQVDALILPSEVVTEN
ncbi:MAG: hypothetical protein IJA14_02185, partial [Alphaproteobacteria bacterium]|nr:hypothetical protein [Alphaproteobacteria bacterium]